MYEVIRMCKLNAKEKHTEWRRRKTSTRMLINSRVYRSFAWKHVILVLARWTDVCAFAVLLIFHLFKTDICVFFYEGAGFRFITYMNYTCEIYKREGNHYSMGCILSSCYHHYFSRINVYCRYLEVIGYLTPGKLYNRTSKLSFSHRTSTLYG